ncbi:MAG: replicative DNA helicase [Salinivirgaceae bacterium]|jgi:replicative DNA helicase|nr:replicative DNA helicase [Salinivirgaceae bacterium]
MAENTKYSGNNNQNKNMAEFGKVPPQVVEFEETVLGALMLEKDAVHSVIDILKAECFYNDAHTKIYKAILSLSLEHKPIDIRTVAQQLKGTGEIDKVGGSFYLAQLTNKVASTAHLEYHSRIIAQKYIQRELIRVGADIQTRAFEEADDVADMLDEAEQDLFQIAEGNIKKEVSRIDAVLREAILQIEEAGKRPDGLSGVPSGFTELDRMTSGWQKSDLLIIAARPAMGKTAFVLSMARNVAVEHKRPIAFFSLEMSSVQLVNRLIVSETELPGDKIKNGNLKDYEWTQLETKIRNLEDAPLYIDDTPALSIFEFRAKLRRLVMQHKIEIAVIDYLQLMTAGGTASREQEVSTISRSLKAIAKELNIPIIALSQLNRSVEMRAGDKRPQLSDLRESGAIEQDADMVMFIHRPEYFGITEDSLGNSLIGLAEIIVAKHRNGSTGDVRLRFKKEFTRFCDVEESFAIPIDGGGVTFESKMNAEPEKDSVEKKTNNKGFEDAGLDINNDFEETTDAPF